MPGPEDAGPERHRYPRWPEATVPPHSVRPDGFLGIRPPRRPREARRGAGGRSRPERSSSSDSDLSDRSWDSAVSPHSSEDFPLLGDRQEVRNAWLRPDRAHTSLLPDRHRRAKRVPDTSQDPRDLDQVPIIVHGGQTPRRIHSNWDPAHLHLWRFRHDAGVGGKYTPSAWICASTSSATFATSTSTASAGAPGSTGTFARADAATSASSAKGGTPSTSADGGTNSAAGG